MPTQITLKVKDEDGNIQKQQHEIEDINLLQFEQTMKVIKDIFVQLQEDESLKDLFTSLFRESADEEENNESTEEENQVIDLQDVKDQQFIANLVNSFETLTMKLPGEAFRLLSVLSDIEINTLRKQKLMDVMDIYDAVIDENDLERLWKRAKKSLAATKVKMSFMKITRKATQSSMTKQVQA